MTDSVENYPFVLSCVGCRRIVTDSFQTLLFRDGVFDCVGVSDLIIENNPGIVEGVDKRPNKNTKELVIKCVCGRILGEYRNGQYQLSAEKLTFYHLGTVAANESNLMTHEQICNEIRKLKKFCVWLKGRGDV